MSIASQFNLFVAGWCAYAVLLALDKRMWGWALINGTCVVLSLLIAQV